MKNFNKLFIALACSCIFAFSGGIYAHGNCTAIVQSEKGVTKTVVLKIYASQGNFRALDFSGGATCSPTSTALGNPITCTIPPQSRFFYIFSHTNGDMTASMWMGVDGERSGTAVLEGSVSDICGPNTLTFVYKSYICANGVRLGVWANNLILNPGC